ncbi:MAG TPA: type 2 lanthipeptide synthetase LanM family protein [Actinocrinis sp.]|uniref:type 2 lanthipeptide synthetase LanM family protein n=1 Tax=Actinocrinis sp. TaxID=1920516 RepID=UPI002DDCBB93|nr:type 2 lanthipeptide synthetase LanM family protein [Actinocrinis sp.]HEV2346769.1 type 2 lanthipeptide synthetase LanM family protein [Actinocrinis sp.]
MIQPGPGVTGSDFTESLACLVEPVLDGLAADLASVPGLGAAEREAIRQGAGAALYETAHRKLCRTLVLELNAARESGQLYAQDSEGRWAEFIAMSASRRYWESLAVHYPTMLGRVDAMLANRRAAALALGRRLAADRSALTALAAAAERGDEAAAGGGGALGDLVEARFGAGDSHRGGQSVVLLRFAGGQAVYKPRSVQVDRVLDGVLREVFGDEPERIRVPAVVVARDAGGGHAGHGSEYGWAQYAEHRYCEDDAQLARFYRGIGHWLALMQLLGGSDLHAENVIANGPVPVVVDCETLFTPVLPPPPSGLGLAVDRAAALVEGTVLRTGILPNRGIALGWRGVDSSAVGSLPGQQPVAERPVLLDGGTDRARIGSQPVGVGGVVASHPSEQPSLAAYWNRVLDGYGEASERLRAMDRDGVLAPLVARFAHCQVRAVLRGTETYAEIGRMLWHPVSLHDPQTAVDRAALLMTKMAESLPGAPDDPRVVEAEVAELLVGDVPYFATTPTRGRLTGPAGLGWLPERDLVAEVLARWRGVDAELDRRVIGAALVTAYLNEGAPSGGAQMLSGPLGTADLDRRRRTLAADLLTRVRDSALHAEDGTVTWIAPVLDLTGWGVQPLGQDMYGGLAGVAVLLAAYRHETAAGRADPVDGLAPLLDATLRTIRAAEDFADRNRTSELRLRPAPPGGYLGLGSQMWSWLTLHHLGAAPDGVDRAAALAAGVLEEAVAEDEENDLLVGSSGAIVPLLLLAEAAGEKRWLRQAAVAGDRLVERARRRDGRAYWVCTRWPRGMGGFAHGATGIGWALARLALATGTQQYADVAQEAFAFEEALWDEGQAGWLDLREPGQTVAAWCHGAVGIGLAAADLERRGWPAPRRPVLDRAVAATARQGFGWNHTLCHGDLGGWEVVAATTPEAGRAELDARILGSVETNGPVSGMARDAFSPGLLGGLGGVAYQLLRMHGDSALPSPLTLGEPDTRRYR